MKQWLKFGLFVGLAAVVYVERAPLRSKLTRTRDSVQATAADFTGKSAVDLGQMAKRQVVQNTLKGALSGYRSVHGEPPHSLDDLLAEGLLQRADLVDEWGRPLQVDPDSDQLVIRSVGADGTRGTADDWVLTR